MTHKPLVIHDLIIQSCRPLRSDQSTQFERCTGPVVSPFAQKMTDHLTPQCSKREKKASPTSNSSSALQHIVTTSSTLSLSINTTTLQLEKTMQSLLSHGRQATLLHCSKQSQKTSSRRSSTTDNTQALLHPYLRLYLHLSVIKGINTTTQRLKETAISARFTTVHGLHKIHHFLNHCRVEGKGEGH